MNTDFLIRGVLESVLGGRRKRSGRALRYLTGGGSSWLSNPTTLLTAAGVAWGIFETMQHTPAPGAIGDTGTGAASAGAVVALPPLPATGQAGPAPALDEATRAVRLAVAAAYADGSLTDAERDAVLAHADAAGVRAVVDEELRSRRPLADIVAGVTDTTHAATLYVLAFTIARADEQVSGADRIFLAQLAHLLGLDPTTVSRLETDTARRIDAAGAGEHD
jgi:uncharacterized membrane protein YebE (DUF533 family)